jgi:hypothetical protein
MAGRILYFLALFLIATTGFAITRHGGGDAAPTDQARAVTIPTGPRLTLIYVAHSECGWCNDPLLPQAFSSIQSRLADHALEQDRSFRSVGVALDRAVDRGVNYLLEFGDFDELSAGGSWSNGWVVRHARADQDLAVPALYLVEQVVDYRNGQRESGFEETEPQILVVRTGVESILTWARSGLPMP